MYSLKSLWIKAKCPKCKCKCLTSSLALARGPTSYVECAQVDRIIIILILILILIIILIIINCLTYL